MTKVLVFGAFDIFHPGHKNFLEQARKKGDELFVVVGRDDTIKELKGSSPHNNQETRLKKIQELDIVTKAVLGNTGDKYKIIEDIKPDIICLGYDQDHYAAKLDSELEKRNLKIDVVRLEPYKESKYKSSKLRMLL